LGRLKFRGSQPLKIPIPGERRQTIGRIPFRTAFPGIPIDNIQVADRIPADERDRAMSFFTWVQILMYRWLSPMQPGLPSIDADPYVALGQAYSKQHRQSFPAPMMPLELQGSPDLGALAVKGPYACYLRNYQVDRDGSDWDVADLSHGASDFYVWDFRELQGHQHLAGVYNLGVILLFRVDRPLRTVQPVRIRSELGLSKPGDNTWEFAKKLALCAATNHLSLVRHFNGVHLASGAQLAIATRNCLPSDHPLCRLLWPYIFRTQQSNTVVTKAQMVKGGDFESMFSFTYEGMCQLFSATYGRYDFTVNDPDQDARNRGIIGGGFDTPTQRDAERIFELMCDHARAYISRYYPSDPAIAGDSAFQAWVDDLNKGIPNGVNRVLGAAITRDSVARVIACFMYLVTVQHQIVGAFLWNYQAWAHRQPPRLYRNGQRVPLDVYQRLVNANFNLNVPRTPLILDEKKPPYGVNDYSYLALSDGRGTAVLQDFQTQLRALEAEWRGEPWSAWRVYPSLLDVNINA
jgi:arachidonate 15-lipoxygenase